ncbi:MAG TPA: SulP family inorganic anion transporter [Pelobium sp.]|nr:SulP family inorganic anion transporter [Pelobium sp.]
MIDHKESLKEGGMAKYYHLKNLKKDLPAGIVVFLVALPLCLGIALASGAPLFSGILAGIVGGVVVASFSGSQLSVSGPAAGLTVIVLTAITDLGSFDAFLLAIFIVGLMQIILGILKAGTIGNYFPNSVILGMLAAIGIILILKQLPHAVGYDADYEGDQAFSQPDNENTLSAISSAISKFNVGAVIITAVSMFILVLWPKVKKLAIIPAPLLVVVVGVFLAQLFDGTSFSLMESQLVQIPVIESIADFKSVFISPDFAQIGNPQIWTVALTIAIVASLETLLSLEAVDKLDPIKRVSPTNRELIAQGIGNTFAGLIGALPVTAVIVRSSTNVHAGGRTKMSAIFHGIFLMVAVLLLPGLINLIPLSCLAAILLLVGYKLANISLFKKMWADGKDQFFPFLVTVLAVVFTDLLTGVGIGLAVGIIFLLRTNYRNPYFYSVDQNKGTDLIRIKLAQEVSFLNKGTIQYTLTHIPRNKSVIIDGTNSLFIDKDVLTAIFDFQEHAHTKNIKVELINIRQNYELPKLKDLIIKPQEENV